MANFSVEWGMEDFKKWEEEGYPSNGRMILKWGGDTPLQTMPLSYLYLIYFEGLAFNFY